jgi:N-acetylmuramoyl-L-alanine amidase
VEPLLAYGARIVGDDARTRIVIDFDREPTLFRPLHRQSGTRIVVDLPATAFGFPAKDLAARGLFKDIRYGKMDEESARIVLTTTRPVRSAIAKVQVRRGRQGSSARARCRDDRQADVRRTGEDAILELSHGVIRAGCPRRRRAPFRRLRQPAAGDFVVAVDAGHGGIDTGAIGVDTKTEEKDR